MPLVEAYLDARAVAGVQRHDRVRPVERRRLVVDVHEHQQPLDRVPVVEVDVHRLPGRRPEPVVPAELHVGRPVDVPEVAAERLYDALGAVLELVQAAQVEVDVDHALAVPEDLRRLERLEGVPQQALALGAPEVGRPHPPGQVDAQMPGGRALLGEGDPVVPFGQLDGVGRRVARVEVGLAPTPEPVEETHSRPHLHVKDRRGGAEESPRRRPAQSVPHPGGCHTPDETSVLSEPAAFPSAAARALLRRTEDQKDQPIRITPTMPVMNSLIWYWMVTRRITASAPIA